MPGAQVPEEAFESPGPGGVGCREPGPSGGAAAALHRRASSPAPSNFKDVAFLAKETLFGEVKCRAGLRLVTGLIEISSWPLII